ncbi:MAG TPA: VOC family protein, partial [Thermoanaerobaculia bacterium]
AYGWRDAWAACGSGDGRTYPAHAPVKRIDYVFVARDAGCDAARVLETTTSDHRPVLVTIPAVAIAVAAPASAQESFDVRFDHSTVLVTDLERSAAFYEDVLQLEPLATPWGPAAPIRFYSLGSGRQLHVGLTDEGIEPDKNDHLALTVSRFDDYLAFLDERGVAYGNFAASSSNPQVRPDGIRQIYLQDPDGNWIEINDAAHPLN